MTRTFLAPAKINLCLHVLGKRGDGYHDLAMVMQRITLYDHLTISVVETPGVRVSCAGLELPPGQDNIAAKAARRLLELSGRTEGVDIDIRKEIPVAAGLGGGSSDAATVLMGLNEMLKLGLSKQRLMREGVVLGADVPFFILEKEAWATGIGDVLEPLEGLPSVWYVLVNPGLAVSTAWVYGNLRLTSPRDDLKIPRFSRTVEDLVCLLHNDLEQVTVARFPVIADIKRRLVTAGASGALMSGSGSTVFGVFAYRATAEAAAEEFRAESGWRVFIAQPVSDYSCRS
ncbi:MAG: 4-(cytidine 5'-diphospho)-2-C-methyl-D-erythritol kinase [Syntrophotaleaceae bacterium]